MGTTNNQALSAQSDSEIPIFQSRFQRWAWWRVRAGVARVRARVRASIWNAEHQESGRGEEKERGERRGEGKAKE